MQSKGSVSKTHATKRKLAVKSSKETLEDVFESMLKDIYWAEKYLTRALPKMAKGSHNEELKEAFEHHLQQTIQHVERIEKCFEILVLREVGTKCEAMEGLVKEGTEVIEEYEKSHARDAALIAAAQKIEHYEISAYGTLRTMANVLGKLQCAELLEDNKDEEVEADEKLTLLAESINHLAAEIEAKVAVEELIN
jgi:ferritin-like metal-binding protein YciE